MKNLFALLFFALCSAVIFNSCKSTGTEPVDTIKSPNEMTWTVDTLYYSDAPQTAMYGICGIAANNIYIYGNNSSAIGSNVIHYDGQQWTPLMLRNYIAYSSIYDMIAFSNSNVWFAGSGIGAEIINYNGTQYIEYWPSSERLDELLTIAGDRPNNIYAAGRNGIILQYTNNTWRVDKLNIPIPAGGYYLIRSAAVYKDTCYLLADIQDTQNFQYKHYFVRGTYKNWTVVDSVFEKETVNWKWGWWGLYTTPDNRLLSFGSQGVWEYTGGAWTKLPFFSQWLISAVFSLNNNYTVAVGHYGTAYFNNGISWLKLDKFEKGYENVVYTGVWGNGKELFIIGYTSGTIPIKTVIFHGK